MESGETQGSEQTAQGTDVARKPDPLGLVFVAVVLLAAFVGYYGLCIWKVLWVGDARVYVAAAREASMHPFSLHHETLNLPASASFAYTPYLRSIALLGRVFGLSPYAILQLGAVGNLTLIVSGLVAMGRTKLWGDGRSAAVFAAAVLLASLFLREKVYLLSSELSASTITLVIGYPSSFAWGVAFWAFALMEVALDGSARQRRAALVAVAVCVAVAMASHPLTGSWLFGVIGLRGLTALIARRRAPSVAIAATAAPVLGALASLLWPNVAFLNSSIVTAKEGIGLIDTPFESFETAYVVGAIALLRLLFSRRRFAGWLFIGWLASFVVFIVLKKAGIDYVARYAFFMVFFVHCAVGTQLADDLAALARPSRARLWRWIVAAIGVALVAAALHKTVPDQILRLGTPSFLWNRPNGRDLYDKEFRPFAKFLREGDTVFMRDARGAMRLASATGARAVDVTFILHLADHEKRIRDVRNFFRAGAAKADRLTLAKRWNVTHVLLAPQQRDLRAEMEAAFGKPVHTHNGFALFETGLKPKRPAKPTKRAKGPQKTKAP